MTARRGNFYANGRMSPRYRAEQCLDLAITRAIAAAAQDIAPRLTVARLAIYLQCGVR